MEKTLVSLTEKEVLKLQHFVKTGKKTGKELERAYVLLALHQNKSYKDIEDFYFVNRTTIWRIAKKYQLNGLLLEDRKRPGQPKKYDNKKEAEIIALACSDSPKGRKRWTIRLLTEYLQMKDGFESISRETIRLVLKKTNINLG